jgi:hypothetical protein
MVRVQENRVIMLLAKNLHYRRSLAHTPEVALALGKAHYDGYVQCASRFEDRLQTGQVRDVEMANGDFVLPWFRPALREVFS